LYKHNWNGELDQAELLAALDEADFFIAQNAKFELQWLARCGYDIGSRPVYDTMLAEWVISGNRGWRLGLDVMLKRYKLGQKGTLVSTLMKNGVCPSEMPREWLLKYGMGDVKDTHALYKKQLEALTDKQINVVYTRCIVIPPLAEIETNGMHLDSTLVEEEYEKHHLEYLKVMAQLDTLTGGINPKSNVQVAQYVYGVLGFKEKKDHRGKFIRGKPGVFKAFPEGLPKTNEETLLSLKTLKNS
jgi:DNA polymerase I-like protein with 3'-5' exonuclease and polymerase domains